MDDFPEFQTLIFNSKWYDPALRVHLSLSKRIGDEFAAHVLSKRSGAPIKLAVRTDLMRASFEEQFKTS